MKRAAVFLLLILSVMAVSAWAQVSDEIIEKTKPAVVVIHCGDGALGSGFIINARGDILTNYHVCSIDSRFSVEFYDGRKFEAQRIFMWEFKDMAILRLMTGFAADQTPFPYLSPNDTTWIANGSAVAAIGHSKYGTWQVIRGNTKLKDYYVYYQPTILYGFSGSPLINERGHVIGLNAGSHNRDESVTKDNFYSMAITLNNIQEFLDYFYGRKTVAKPEPPAIKDTLADKCVWQKTKKGQWCRHE